MSRGSSLNDHDFLPEGHMVDPVRVMNSDTVYVVADEDDEGMNPVYKIAIVLTVLAFAIALGCYCCCRYIKKTHDDIYLRAPRQKSSGNGSSNKTKGGEDMDFERQ